MESIAFNGTAIHWPPLCACCCREADTTVNLKKTVEDSSYNWFTRTTTTQYTTRSWDVPYCKSCLEHIHAERAVREFSESPMNSFVVICFVVALGCIVAAVALSGSDIPPWLYYAILVLLAVLALLVLRITYPICRARYDRERAVINHKLETLRQTAKDTLCETCVSPGSLAVKYEGWKVQSHHGQWTEETHFFSFQNKVYATLMVQLNDGNCQRKEIEKTAD